MSSARAPPSRRLAHRAGAQPAKVAPFAGGNEADLRRNRRRRISADELGHLEARGAQRLREPDERQPDEGGRIHALDALEECDAGPFRLEATGTIERLFAGHVALDLRSTQHAEAPRSGVDT